MKSALRPLLYTIVALGGLLSLLIFPGDKPPAQPILFLYCAAGMQPPIETITRQYASEYGIIVQVQYGGSGTLLSNLEVSGAGDLYLAADATYIELAQEKGLLSASYPIAYQRPVLVVASGNPKNVRGLNDLVREDLRVALANPDAASIGKTTRAMLEKSGHWRAIAAAVQSRGVFKPTVNDVANDVKIGTVDAGIIWNTTAAVYSELDAMPLPEAAGYRMAITIGVLRSAVDTDEAERFVHYLKAPGKGLEAFKALGCDVFLGEG